MPPTRADVIAKARELFGEDSWEAALALVDEYGTQAHEREVDRVKIAILEVSDGRIKRLPYFIKCAQID